MKSITILTLLLALAACARHDAPTPIAAAVELAPVREETRGSATRYSATVAPDAQVAVAFRVSGYVDAIIVEEGDRVAKGTVLARIRTADYEQKLGQATASQAEARTSLTDEGTTWGLRRPGPTAPDPVDWPSLRDTLSRDTKLCRGG